MKFFLTTIILSLTCLLQAQVVNIETRRLHTDSIRHAGDANLSFAYTNNNGRELFTLRSNLLYQVKSKSLRDIWLIIGQYELAKSPSQQFSNALFGHLRYNRKLNNLVRWEAFTQVQKNHPLGIYYRFLAGTGPRFKLLGKPNVGLYLGALYMHEWERTIKPAFALNRYHRLSSYISATISIPAIKAEIITTTYYQPDLTYIADYRWANETRMDFNLTSKLRIFSRFHYLFDSRPPASILQRSLGFEQGFGLKF